MLAAGRGADDPMVQAFGTSNKCLLKVGGTPMIVRVLTALSQSQTVSRATISIEDPAILEGAEGFAEVARAMPVDVVKSSDQASSSVARALTSGAVSHPLLVTTADHALLSPAMVDDFCTRSRAGGTDLTAGLARDTTILAAYPDSVRTFLKFSDGKFSGCNLFTFNTPRSMAAIEFWQRVERNRKTPWKLIGTFGVWALVRYLTGTLSLTQAFTGAGRKLGLTAEAVELFTAEAAIDVDKPADLALAESILAASSQ